MEHNEEDFETEVKKFIRQNGRVRRRELIDYLIREHVDKRGYSAKNINRKLDKMLKQGTIRSVKYADFEKLGIKDTDQRACYLILVDITQTKELMGKVMAKIVSKNHIIQKKALKETDLQKEFCNLPPEKLDLVINRFYEYVEKEKMDDELTYRLLLLLKTHILEIGIEPKDKEKTIKLFEQLLEKYPLPVSTYENLRTYIIYLLGHYKDEIVIKRLMEDARTLEDLSSIENVYKTEYTAILIYKHFEELYELEEELELKGNEKGSQFLFDIRVATLEILGLRENPHKLEEEVVHLGEISYPKWPRN